MCCKAWWWLSAACCQQLLGENLLVPGVPGECFTVHVATCCFAGSATVLAAVSMGACACYFWAHAPCVRDWNSSHVA